MERTGPLALSWVVHKFGGTSVANGSRIKNVSQIIRAEMKAVVASDPAASDLATAVVVSAMGGITNAFLQCISLAESKSPDWANKLDIIVEAHLTAVLELGLTSTQAVLQLIDSLKSDAKDVRDVLHAIALTQSCSKAARDMIISYGELWSSRLLYATFKELYGSDSIGYADPREFITVQETDVGPAVLWPETREKLAAAFQNFKSTVRIIVAPGFVCRGPNGVATTLSRNGSDFSATIFGALLSAIEVHIWTDVDGIFSADPRKVPNAVLIAEMTYTEALELSYFGAKVLHHQSIQPVMSNTIPLWIRNTFGKSRGGTKIAVASQLSEPFARTTSVKAFSLIDQISLLNVEGTGMQGVSGIAERIFGALKNAGVSVTLITQASSEHSVTAAIPSQQGSVARRAVQDAFFREISNNLIQTVDIVNDCSILAAVGDGMIHTKGVAAKLFASLATANVNVLAIAQGSSERNISVVISDKDSDLALKSVHDAFYAPPAAPRFVNIAIIGYGGVGSALERQLRAARARLESQLGFEIRLRVVSRSRQMLVGDNLLESDIDSSWASFVIPNDSASVARLLLAGGPAAAIVIDTSASESVTELYLGWIQQGIHVIAANKKFFSGNLERFRQMQSLTRSKVSCLFEATVCAGLPVLSTISDMIDTGDEIESITGVFSGTLSFLFNTLRNSNSTFSQIVRQAKDLGYTEPDPRDDLSGLDFARKVVILARLAGLDSDLSNVELRGLVPQHLCDCSVSDFMNQLQTLDAEVAEKKEKALLAESTLAYIGVVDIPSKRVTVSLESIPLSSPIASLTDANNVISIKTKRYQAPMIVRGPGAGAEVTAAGVFSDILKVLRKV